MLRPTLINKHENGVSSKKRENKVAPSSTFSDQQNSHVLLTSPSKNIGAAESLPGHVDQCLHFPVFKWSHNLISIGKSRFSVDMVTQW